MGQASARDEILHAISLSKTQFQTGLALAESPSGLEGDALVISTPEIDEMITRGLIAQAGDHYHATPLGSGLLRAIANYIAAAATED